MKKGEFCWKHQHCHDIFSGKKYIRKDSYGAHQEKCPTLQDAGSKKIRLVKKKKKKKEKEADTLNTGSIECYLCSKRLKCPSSYTHHLSTSHYAEELMSYLKCQWTGDGQSRCWSCSRCDYTASNRWPIIAHLGSNRHNLLKEVATPEVWDSIPPPIRHVGGAQRPPQGLVIASVESEVPAPPSEASDEVTAELPKAEASVAVSPAIKEEPDGSTCRSGSTPISGDIRDIFNLTSDEESSDEMEAPSYRPILEPVIENLGSHIDTADLASVYSFLVSTPKDGDKSV